jgi:Sec-independent protein translocase protein TatA
MPEWLRDVVLALGAFLGGRVTNGVGGMVRRGAELRTSVDKLTYAVENVGGDLKEIRSEMRRQGEDIKQEFHQQLQGLRQEMHANRTYTEQRLENIEIRVDGVGQQVVAMAAASEVLINRPRTKHRLDYEMGCAPPPDPAMPHPPAGGQPIA